MGKFYKISSEKLTFGLALTMSKRTRDQCPWHMQRLVFSIKHHIWKRNAVCAPYTETVLTEVEPKEVPWLLVTFLRKRAIEKFSLCIFQLLWATALFRCNSGSRAISPFWLYQWNSMNSGAALGCAWTSPVHLLILTVHWEIHPVSSGGKERVLPWVSIHPEMQSATCWLQSCPM